MATAALGHLECITDEQTGLLVPAEDVAAMAKAIARLVDEPDLATQARRAARANALDRFSTGRYEREIVGLFASLTEASSRNRSRR